MPKKGIKVTEQINPDVTLIICLHIDLSRQFRIKTRVYNESLKFSAAFLFSFHVFICFRMWEMEVSVNTGNCEEPHILRVSFKRCIGFKMLSRGLEIKV